MSIRFTKIRWKNFLSTGGQFTEIDFESSPSTLIVGENGAGKSTILDAICFGLFNKPFRSINKPQLMNTINGKNLSVEVEFSIGKKDYKIVRGMKPNIFEIYCDGTILNQDAASRDYQKYLEESILKLNYKSFTQIVILGSASFTPFMQLSLGYRREIIEDILDIQIFSVMNNVLKDKINSLKDAIKDLDGKIEIGKHKIKVQQGYILQLEEDKKKRENDVQTKIDESSAEIVALSTQLEDLQDTYAVHELSVSDSDEQAKKKTELNTLYRNLTDRIKKAKNEINFYEEHDNCPTCNQNISDDLKTMTVEKHTHKIEAVTSGLDQINVKITEVETRLTEIETIKKSMSDVQVSILKVNNSMIASQNYIKKLMADLEQKDDTLTSLTNEKINLKSMAKEIVDLVSDRSKINEDKFYHEAAGSLLKDTGIKTKIIRQYLPVINKLVNKYLTAMDFFVHFELDESFNETIKSRHRDEFSYASFSEGEKQRIDLALLFTWRTIAKMKNSASTNLLLLDEVFDSSLDANGTDYVMNLLNTISDDTNVFVISHKGDQLIDKFKSVIKFQKYQNFSRIV
jgi:DNA repair exonuclease SbcCD ATPase subunit